jgi:hypothetical protein
MLINGFFLLFYCLKKLEKRKMTTPKRQDIIERAFEIRQKRNYNVSSITPEVEELAEDGTLIEARDSLMRNEESEFLDYLEKEANTLGYILAKEKVVDGRQRKPFDFEIDLEEALRSGVFISGGKGTTKSNLAMTIAEMLMQKGITIKVFDISQAWRKSSIPKIYELRNNTNITINLYESAVYDISRLTPKEAKDFINKFLANEWNLQISIPEEKRKPIVYTFEEVQMLLPSWSLRNIDAQQVLRLLTSGRNYKLGFIAVTQRPALCDTSVFELSFQRYFARMDGQNDLKKVANHIGAKARELQNLKLGEFLYDMGTQTKWIATAEFRSSVKPQKISFAPSKPIRTQTKALEVPLLFATVAGALGFALLIVAMLI